MSAYSDPPPPPFSDPKKKHRHGAMPRKKRTRKRAETSAKNLARLEKITRAVELRNKGKSQAEIAKEIGVCQKTAHNLLVAAMKGANLQNQEGCEVMRHDLMSKLEWMYSKLVLKIEEGHLPSIEMGAKLVERTAKIAGVWQQEQHHHQNFSVTTNNNVYATMSNEALAAEAKKLEMLAAALQQKPLLPLQDVPNVIDVTPNQNILPMANNG